MELLQLLQQYNIINIIIVISIIGIIYNLRNAFLDNFLQLKIKNRAKIWILLTTIALLFSLILTFISMLNKLDLVIYIQMSIQNWIFSWISYDTLKNLFFKNKDKNKNRENI